MFQRFPSLTRFSHDWTITEKIDGTNACIIIEPDERVAWGYAEYDYALVAKVPGFAVYAQSRNNLIFPKVAGKPETDNMGFARWIKENTDILVEILGPGRHYGEWCGAGIQRGYGLTTKKFALFNTHRWGNVEFAVGTKGGDLAVVPTLARGYMENPGLIALQCMENLKANGSEFAPGFMDPEGVVMRHNPSGTVFKKTFDYDEQGKWAENQTRKAQNA